MCYWGLDSMDPMLGLLWERDFNETKGVHKSHEGKEGWMWSANGSKRDVYCNKKIM